MAAPQLAYSFHPAVAAWLSRTHGEPTAPQARGWPAIQARQHTLIAAPTGSGKTLAAFLAAIDGLVRQGQCGPLPDETQVLYISPLKALSNDVQKNLQEPLEGIQADLKARGYRPVNIRTVVRTGDTPTSVRAAMVKRPPHIVVTTPESFYLLLTSVKGRKLLATVRTVIVDEIHALVQSKRGSHLALSLERLEALTLPHRSQQDPAHPVPLLRIGLSATQKPIEVVAQFLVGGHENGNAPQGAGSTAPACTVIDTGLRKHLDVAIELPNSPLEGVMALEVWAEIYARLVQLIQEHRTTLIFVNTRRMAERVARALSEPLGAEHVMSHHGSLSREARLQAEQRLKSGSLRVLVATASLELGIDIGSVDLVCQLGSVRAISTFLQRVGRSRHHLGGVPKGRLFPLTRDELVECAALLDAVRRGELDALTVPTEPLDVLSQQIVAMAACEDLAVEDLYALVRRAYPYRQVTRATFDAVIDMLGKGFVTARGRRSAYLHVDAVNGKIRGRKGARLTAITNGGAIPDNADYDVVLEPSDTFVGTVNEDWAIESMAGDVFQLGNTSWRILRVESGKVRVEDAKGQPPSIPFWLGEAPGRSKELSAAVGRLRESVDHLLAGEPLPQPLPPPPPAEQPATHGVKPAPARLGAQLELGAEPHPRPKPAVSANAIAPAAVVTVAALAPARLAPVLRWLTGELGLSTPAALQVAEYLASARAALGVMPSQKTLVLERFFDESGGMQLVLHSPFGSRINRAWGLSLRKRFCRTFNFELQAAATEDAIVLSLGPTHSFPLEEVFGYLNSRTVRPLLVQALLAAPMFPIRWRWNTNVALAVLRRQGDRKVSPFLQRMRAEDLLTLVFPDQVACGENIVGDREVPDHPLVNETIRDCLESAMDIEGLEALLAAIERGEKQLVGRDLREPSQLSAEILNARPYAFLDDAPLEERRTRAVSQRRWLDPETAATLGALDAAAIAQVRQEAWPSVANADEMHDALLTLGYLTAQEVIQGPRTVSAPAPDAPAAPAAPVVSGGWEAFLPLLLEQGRATEVRAGARAFWVAAEWIGAFRQVYPQGQEAPALTLPPALAQREWTVDTALPDLLRVRLAGTGPVTPGALADQLGLPEAEVLGAVTVLESEGFLLRGRYTPGGGVDEWCERGLLARIHRYTLNRLRREIEPVTLAEYMRFLAHWQRVEADQRVTGVDGLSAAVEVLEGFEAPAAAWESELLAARVDRYDPEWLERLCLSGRVVWARLTPPPMTGARRWGPVATTPIALLQRSRLPQWAALLEATPTEPLALSSPARAVAEHLLSRGASFFDDLATSAGLLPTQLEEALGELVNWGLVTADNIAGIRALITPASKRPPVRMRGRLGTAAMESAGRWSLLPWALGRIHPAPEPERGKSKRPPGVPADALEAYAMTLLRRYGVVFRRLLERERLAPAWYELLRVYRLMEARGTVRGGRFVTGVTGEQYALPDAVTQMRDLRRRPTLGRMTTVSAADPLNLAGIVTPGDRVPATAGNRVLFRDGEPLAAWVGGELVTLATLDEATQRACRVTLHQHGLDRVGRRIG
jgi:ATP-dependent Lhr-like helicase